MLDLERICASCVDVLLCLVDDHIPVGVAGVLEFPATDVDFRSRSRLPVQLDSSRSRARDVSVGQLDHFLATMFGLNDRQHDLLVVPDVVGNVLRSVVVGVVSHDLVLSRPSCELYGEIDHLRCWLVP